VGLRGNHEDVSVITPKAKTKKVPPKMVPFRASEEFIKEIDEAAEAKGVSRNEAMTQLLRFALDAEHGRAKKRNG
jgi:hypothetical protein